MHLTRSCVSSTNADRRLQLNSLSAYLLAIMWSSSTNWTISGSDAYLMVIHLFASVLKLTAMVTWQQAAWMRRNLAVQNVQPPSASAAVRNGMATARVVRKRWSKSFRGGALEPNELFSARCVGRRSREIQAVTTWRVVSAASNFATIVVLELEVGQVISRLDWAVAPIWCKNILVQWEALAAKDSNSFYMSLAWSFPTLF